MAEHKYRFNPNTLNFERIRTSGWKKLKRISLALAPGLLMGVIGIFLAFQFIDSPKEATLRRENQQLQVEYELINKQLADMEDVLSDIERRDDNVYRVIFEADPIPSTVRMAGIGGVNRYKDLSGFANSELVIGTRKRLDMIAKRMYVQSLSLDEVGSLVLRKQEMLASIPAVQPIPTRTRRGQLRLRRADASHLQDREAAHGPRFHQPHRHGDPRHRRWHGGLRRIQHHRLRHPCDH